MKTFDLLLLDVWYCSSMASLFLQRSGCCVGFVLVNNDRLRWFWNLLMVVGRLKCFISFISSICLIFLSGVEISDRLKVKFLAYFGSRNCCIVLTSSFRFRFQRLSYPVFELCPVAFVYWCSAFELRKLSHCDDSLKLVRYPCHLSYSATCFYILLCQLHWVLVD